MAFSELNTQQRALQINLDRRIYGTFAEIGAGQEIARWFFRVGGAAGTVAKTMSAYDMAVSDAIYGKSSRYVARDRVLSMLDHEYPLLLQRLEASRGTNTSFFVFANTVSARNYLGTNECHGWMGLRFQMAPGSPPSDVIFHVNMLDRENLLQQEALGVVGVNLIYGAFYDRSNIDSFIENLVDDLGQERIEIDILEMTGPAFDHVDNRVVGLKLLQLGLANAIIYDPGKQLEQPSEIVHKRPVLIERGGFRAIHRLNLGSVQKAEEAFKLSISGHPREPVSLLELTMHEAAQKETLTPEQTLERIDALTALGSRVIVSRYYEFYQVTSYLRRYTDEPIGYVMGIGTLLRLMNPSFYEHLEGRFLEGLGRVLSHNVRLYVYPMFIDDVRDMFAAEGVEPICTVPADTSMISVHDLAFKPPLDSLFRFLLESKFIEPVGLE